MTITAIQVGSDRVTWRMSAFATTNGPEEELQRALEDYPALIPWEQIGASSQLAILNREVSTVEGKRMDHVGVDSSGTIYVIECKIVTNQEIRSVIAQALEYCAQLSNIYCVNDFLGLCKRTEDELPFCESEAGRQKFLAGLERCIQRADYRAIVVTDCAINSSQARVNRATVDFLRSSLEIHLVEIGKYTSSDSEVLYVPSVTAGGPQVSRRSRDAIVWKRNFLGVYSEELDLNAALLRHMDWVEDVNPGGASITKKTGAFSSHINGFYVAYFEKVSNHYTLYIPPVPKCAPEDIKARWKKLLTEYDIQLGKPLGKAARRIESVEQITAYSRLLKELYELAMPDLLSEPA
jgi:bacterioferritin-associated ferredoxin